MSWNYKNRTPGHVMEALLERAIGLWCSHPLHHYRKDSGYMSKPGELVQSLPEKDRELLKNLTIKDFDHRPDVTPHLYGSNATCQHRGRYSRVLAEQRAIDKKTM
ncbi:MAG TPA: hypothetical protein DIW31_06620 [Bacteroidales bacterium]|nr:hypothetical protein [Bacteroidales bacterium]